MSQHSIFSDIEQITRTDHLGNLGQQEFRFPTFFFESTCTMAGLLCPMGELSKVTLSLGYKPLTILPGKGMLVVSFYQHQRVDQMQPYDEVVISTPVYARQAHMLPLLPLLAPKPMGTFGHLVLDMPVNSPLNRLRGNLLWNLPKTDADIQISKTSTRSKLRCASAMLELELEVEARGKAHDITTTSRIYGAMNGAPTAFYNTTNARFCKANQVFPIGPNPQGTIRWQARPGHPLAGLDPTNLKLFETRLATDYKSVLYLPGQEFKQ